MFTVNVLLNICKCSSSDVDKADSQNVHMQHVSRAGTYAVATGMAVDKWELEAPSIIYLCNSPTTSLYTNRLFRLVNPQTYIFIFLYFNTHF